MKVMFKYTALSFRQANGSLPPRYEVVFNGVHFISSDLNGKSVLTGHLKEGTGEGPAFEATYDHNIWFVRIPGSATGYRPWMVDHREFTDPSTIYDPRYIGAFREMTVWDESTGAGPVALVLEMPS